MKPTPQTRTHPAGSPFAKPRLPKRQSAGTVRVQQAFPEQALQALLHALQATFTALAFDCNPTHFVTPQGHPVTHDAFAPQRLCPIVVRHIGPRTVIPPTRWRRHSPRCKVTPSFRIDPSKGFPVRAVLPGPRAFFCARNSRACPPASRLSRAPWMRQIRLSASRARKHALTKPSRPLDAFRVKWRHPRGTGGHKNEGSPSPMLPVVLLSPVYGCRMCCARWALPPYCLSAVRRLQWPPIRLRGWRACRTFQAR